MSDWADNFDSEATIDDESCYKVGCMWPHQIILILRLPLMMNHVINCMWFQADNFDPEATIDDESCYREGCMSD